jgi:tetratricopeptide (TPR) repeat protein
VEEAKRLNERGVSALQAGRYVEAEPRALAIREKTLGKEHPRTATTLTNLASLYEAQGKYAQAEPLYLRALAIDEKAYGVERPEVATDLNNLAYLYKAQGEYGKALPLYERALAIREKRRLAKIIRRRKPSPPAWRGCVKLAANPKP